MTSTASELLAETADAAPRKMMLFSGERVKLVPGPLF